MQTKKKINEFLCIKKPDELTSKTAFYTKSN